MVAGIGQTTIINNAMVLLGSSQRLTSIGADGPLAANMRDAWDIALPAALESYPWHFATRRCFLDRDTKRPPFGYAFQYRLPADCVRWLPWQKGEREYFEGEQEGNLILTGVHDSHIHYIEGPDGADVGCNRLPIRYTALITDLSLWSALFCDAMANRLAARLCMGSTSSRTLTADLDNKLREIVDQARIADGLSTARRARGRGVRGSRWASARFSALGISSR